MPKKCVDAAEFVRADNGEYYFLSVDRPVFALEDVDVIVAVFAKDRVDDDYRAWYVMDLTIEYSSAERNDVLDTEYDVDQSSPVLEFDDDLDSCRLNFSDDSYFNLKLTSTRVFNFGYSFEPNTIIADANPNAEMKFSPFMPSRICKAPDFEDLRPRDSISVRNWRERLADPAWRDKQQRIFRSFAQSAQVLCRVRRAAQNVFGRRASRRQYITVPAVSAQRCRSACHAPAKRAYQSPNGHSGLRTLA